nr:bifunctional 4-hydroxy-2-oxoglutarate aldolase/2-dehydro-3-deoxy-phosphogluconate aldolase [Vibrio sinensis]
MTELVNQLANCQIVPIAVVDDPKKAIKVAQILIENELPCIEVAFRSNKTPNIIKQLRDTYPQMLIGAGSITKIEQVDLAIEAGANFLVSPSINPNVVHYCQEKGIDLIVSINSPYLIEKAMEVGVMTMKFFPAEASGGAPMLKAISAVYPDVKFIPSGGINPFNLVNYLSISNVACVSGTWLIPPALIEAEEWQQIAEFIEDELRFVRE